MQASVDTHVDTTVDRRERETKEFAEAIKQATPEQRKKVIELLKRGGYLK